jgi:hypothetical protein
MKVKAARRIADRPSLKRRMEVPRKFRNVKGLKSLKSLKSLNFGGTDEEQILYHRSLGGRP